jgi:hypothetical protein
VDAQARLLGALARASRERGQELEQGDLGRVA